VNIHRVLQKATSPGLKLKPFLVVATRDTCSPYSLVTMSFEPNKDNCGYEEQVKHISNRYVFKLSIDLLLILRHLQTSVCTEIVNGTTIFVGKIEFVTMY
jgi:hypothetical protein